MSMTTDLTGGLFGPTEEERKAQASLAAAATRAEADVQTARIRADSLNPGKLPGMPLGRFSSAPIGVAPTGGKALQGVADLRFAEAARNGAELGEPTSFRGGAGAPEPVGVIRGMRQAYATEAGGPNLTEFATPVQAQQAFNREQAREAGNTPEAVKQYGEFVPTGGTLEAQKHTNKLLEIAAQGKSQEVAAGTALRQQQQGQQYLNQMLLSEYGVEDPKTKEKVLPDYVQKAALSLLPEIKDMGGVQQLMEKIRPALEQGKQIDVFNNPATRGNTRSSILANYQADMQAQGKAADPNVVRWITSEPVTPANLAWFQQRVSKIGKVSANPSAPAPTVQAPAPTSLQEYANLPAERRAQIRNDRLIEEAGGPIDNRGFGLWNKLNGLAAQREKQEMEKDFASTQKKTPEATAAPLVTPPVMPKATKPQASLDLRIPNLTAGQPVRPSLYDEVAVAGKG